MKLLLWLTALEVIMTTTTMVAANQQSCHYIMTPARPITQKFHCGNLCVWAILLVPQCSSFLAADGLPFIHINAVIWCATVHHECKGLVTVYINAFADLKTSVKWCLYQNRFIIKIVFLGIWISIIKIRRSCDRFILNGNPCIGKTVSLYWIGALSAQCQ